ncbi:MAG: hypothetical protein VKM01_02715 [Cyanobacteriota bacterium]|nr:hypothetical protein [Cyanobacteriota bacterium]
MKCSEPHRVAAGDRLVVVACGPDPAVAALVTGVAPALAEALGWPLQAPPASDDPMGALAALGQQPGPWLAGLLIDPGRPLAMAGCWAEALAAWHQPVVVLIEGAQIATGTAAGASALLRLAGVPLPGLIQVGGAWLAPQRRRDGLPWLGPISAVDPSPTTTEDIASLVPLIRHRLGEL